MGAEALHVALNAAAVKHSPNLAITTRRLESMINRVPF
jgi:hypothetical protein